MGEDARTIGADTRKAVVRRAVGAVALVGLVGAGIVVSMLPGTRAEVGGPAVASTSPSGSPSAVDPTAPSTTPGSAPTELPDTGPGIDSPGVTMVANPRNDDTFEVVEAVRFDQPMTRLPVAPPDLRELGGDFKASSTSVTELSVLADGHPVDQRAKEITQPLDLATEGDVTQVVVRYVLTGAIVRSRDYPDPSVGRALGALRPLTTVADGTPVMIRVPSSGVRSLSCPLYADGVTACSVALDTGIRFITPLPAEQAIAQVQVDLGPAR